VTATRTPAQVLAASRRETSLRKRQTVLDTVHAMAADDEPISFAAVARRSGVSTWLVYADGVREHVQTAIARQAHQPAAAQRDGRQASSASLRTELATTRAEVAELRAERDRLRNALRANLGQQLDQVSNRHLTERITELTEQARVLERSEAEARAHNAQLTDRVAELEADLAAARTSLRSVMREVNRTTLENQPRATPDAGPGPAPGHHDVIALPTHLRPADQETDDDEH
jgi:hypothetical protein